MVFSRQILWYRALTLLLLGVNLANACDIGCNTCSNDNLCTNCSTIYYLNDGGCIACRSNCTTCADFNNCYTCDSGYYGTYCQNDCSLCQDGLCSKDGCTEGCKEGYYDAGIGGCKTCRSNCISCSEFGICDKCVTGKWGTVCKNSCDSYHCTDNICAPDNAECNNGCADGFYLDKKSCYGCPVFCKTCTIKSCGSCIDGRWGVTCELQCPGSCSTCDTAGKCGSDCAVGYYNSSISNSCTPCSKVCSACSSPNVCTSCTTGYVLSGSTCILCPTQCSTCSTPNVCTACTTGYVLSGSTCILQCPTQCSTCSYPNMCTACKTGYVLSGSTCKLPCPTECSTCSSPNVCTACKTGYVLSESTCILPCPTECSTCSSPNVCTSCTTGYVLSGSTCILCPTQCSTCSSPNVCTACTTGYVLSGITCILPCPTECSTCSSPNVCTACKTGYVLSGSTCILPCPTECSTCSSPNVCTSCTTGYVLSGSACILCPSQCSTCSSPNVCTACTTGYVLSGSTCILCSTQCSTCSSPNVCTSCTTGYVLSGSTCILCPTQCSTCSSPNVCTSCTTGYVLSESTCILCPTQCSTCSSPNVCTACTTGYVLSGSTCIQQCPTKCSTCTSPNVCTSCTTGYVLSGSTCIQQCPDGCSTCTSLNVCTSCTTDHELSGNICNKAAQTADTDTNVAVIGGAAGGAVIVIIIAVAVVICIIRKRRNQTNPRVDEEIQPVNAPPKYYVYLNTNVTGYLYATVNKTKQNEAVPMANIPKPSSLQEAPPVPSNAHLEDTDVDIEYVEIDEDEFVAPIHEQPANDNVYYTNVAGLKRSRIQVDRLQNYVEKKTNNDFLNEFKKLPQGLARPFNDAMKPINRAKNRYKSVYPYDISRVKLLDGGPDFINANYIDGYNSPTSYIASLGPTQNTMDDYKDFWRMVWQEKVGKIVMLTNLMENGTMKCEQYWPNRGVSQSYGNVVVTCHSEDKYSEHTIKGLTVAKGEERRSLIHFHFTAWPDKGVPDDVTSLIEFRQRVLSTRAETDGPVIVHCSAGVGRTGTYIALDILTKEGIAEKSVDIFGCVLGMRSQRASMVQTEEQYEYIHRSVVHALTFDCRAVQGNQFQQYMADSTEKLPAQFKHIESTVERKSEEEIKAVKRNSIIHNKNRKHADVSGDRYRPRLYLRRKPGASDYINAVFVNSYKAKNRYIVAQTPLPGTIVDFLSLVVQERCPCIVSMDEENIPDKTVGVYLPASNQILKHGTFNISCVSCETTSGYILRKLKIKFHGMNGPEEKTINHFQIPSWTKGKLVPESSTFLKLVQDVEKAADESTDNGRIVVHCLAGGERSGLFCAVSVLIQKMEVDHEVSVVNTVRQIKTRRHSAIPNKEQYVFCHQCVSAYVQSFDIYSNFSHM